MGLPVKDLDDLYVWENLEFSLLCLEELQFKPILEDALSKAKEKQDKILAKRSVQTTTNNKFNEDFTEEIKNEIKQDKFISEMEGQFADGNFGNIQELLKKYD